MSRGVVTLMGVSVWRVPVERQYTSEPEVDAGAVEERLCFNNTLQSIEPHGSSALGTGTGSQALPAWTRARVPSNCRA